MKKSIRQMFSLQKSKRMQTVLVALCFVFIIPVVVSAQEFRTTLKKTDVPIQTIIQELEQKSGYTFFYNDNQVSLTRKVSIDATNANIETILSQLFKNTEYSYTIVDKQIVIKKTATKALDANQTSKQQKQNLAGFIRDEQGQAILGATIMEKGTDNGTVTNVSGKFSFMVYPQSVIVISYVGYKTQEIALNGRKELNVSLKEDAQMLSETIVIGYGRMKKSDLTGAISSVNIEELSKRSTTNPAEALQGKVSGVNIQKAGGNAGSTVRVKIRGVKTFGDNNPLYIIDGFPGEIENVNPQDIESMEVLKDGAAAAIYGSVAANGVIIITTKNGKKGEVKVDVSSYVSFTDVAKKLELLNAAEYKSVHKQMYDNYNKQAAPADVVTLPDYLGKETGIDSDWQGIMLRSGLSKNTTVSVRGGTDKAQYAISYNHSDDKGIFLGNSFSQDNARAKIHMTKSIFEFDTNIGFKFSDNQQPGYSLKEMYMISPLVPVYDSSRKYGYGLTDFDGLPNNRNVMADHFYKSATDKKYSTNANVSVTVNFTKWLSFKSSYSYRGDHQRTTEHTPTYIADEKSKREYPFQSEFSSYWQEKMLDNVLTFNKEFNKHSVNAMVGSFTTERTYNWNSVSVEGKTTVYKVENSKLVTTELPAGFLDESFSTIGAGKGGTYIGDGTNWQYNRASFFGRLNYNYGNRYLIQATMRYDGSSKFGPDRRWGAFPSVALGWRISEEEFFPKDIAVSNLKLRASWGRLGNEVALGYYDFQALITTYNNKYQGYIRGTGESQWPGSIARGLEARDLKWETTNTKNIGVDFGIFKNKLNGSLNYYHNQTDDLLITRALAPSAGIDNPILNVGKLSNSGIEIELNWNDRIKDFGYNIGFNLSTIKNRVVELANSKQVLYGEGLKYGTEHFPTQTRVGKPIGSYYLYKTNGLFQSDAEVKAYVNNAGDLIQPNAQAGDIRFVDLNGDGAITDDDKDFCGSGIPTLEANLNLSFDYKGFDMSFVLGSAWGHKLYNGNKYFYEGMNSGSNFLKSTLNAWSPENTNTTTPRAVYSDPNGNLKESDRFLEDGSFIRLRQAQLGYSLPTLLLKKVYLEKLRFYLSGENLFTITKYEGIDPEFSRASVLSTGIDNLIYPFTRSFIVGVQITF